MEDHTMSFASAAMTPASYAARSAGNLLRGGTLPSMARAVSVVVTASVLAASYQIAVDEGRQFIVGLRSSSALRRARNDAALLLLMTSELPLELKDKLRRARDVFKVGMAMLTDPAVAQEDREIIHGMLTQIVNGTLRP
jgi:hypothetical protein